MGQRGVVKASKGVTLVISNEDMDDIIRIIKSYMCLWNVLTGKGVFRTGRKYNNMDHIGKIF